MLKITELMELGCSVAFAKKAMAYTPMHRGDTEFFIQEIEEMLGTSRSNTTITDDSSYSQSGCYQTPMDKGVMQSELDYNGDLLTYYGYEFTMNSRRG